MNCPSIVQLFYKVIEPGPDRTVGPKNPWTVQIHGSFKVRNRSMRKKHGTIRTAVRPSGSMNRDRFGWFRLFQPLNDVVQLLLFFSPIQRHSEMAPAYFFPPYTASFCPFSKSLFWNPFSFLNHSQPSLVSASLKNHSQILTFSSLNLSLAPSHCRSSVSSSLSRCCLSPASPSQRSLDRSSLVAVAAQPRYFIYGITNTNDSELQ